MSLRESLPFNSSVRYRTNLVGRVLPGKQSGWENPFVRELLPVGSDFPGKLRLQADPGIFPVAGARFRPGIASIE
jgi:hypothetical protein